MPPIKKKTKTLIPKIISIGDLRYKCKNDPDAVKYQILTFLASKNLGGDPTNNLDQAIRWLETNAMETDEDGVVEEINFCRDLV